MITSVLCIRLQQLEPILVIINLGLAIYTVLLRPSSRYRVVCIVARVHVAQADFIFLFDLFDLMAYARRQRNITFVPVQHLRG